MTQVTNVGIIGVGQIGKYHVANYAKIPQARIVAIADVNEAEAKRVAAENGIPHVYTNFRDLLARDDIEAVDVCLHNNYHAPITVAVLEAGKHAFCEKPMAGAYADALAMYQAHQRTGKRLGIQIATLFTPDTKAARRLLDAGALGRLYYGRAAFMRRRGRPFVDGYGTASFVQKAVATGGALIDVGIYQIGQMLYLMDNPNVQTVSGRTYQELDMHAGRRASSGFDVEEMALGFVRLSDNVTMDIEISWAQQYEQSESSKLLGSKGGIRLDPLNFYSTVADMEMSGTFDLKMAEFRIHSVDPTYAAYDAPQEHWIATLQGVVPGIDTAAIALNTSLISDGIYLSTKQGRELTVEEIQAQSVSTAIWNV